MRIFLDGVATRRNLHTATCTGCDVLLNATERTFSDQALPNLTTKMETGPVFTCPAFES